MADSTKKTPAPAKKRKGKKTGLTIFFAILSFVWILPLLIVLLNSFKNGAFIFKNPFGISRFPLSRGFERWLSGIPQAFVGWNNYIRGIAKTDFGSAFLTTLFITVLSVALIILCCSMTAWYIIRVKNMGTRLIYTLCLFSMIVPFQMVMFTLSKFSNMLKLSNPLGICIVYLGFGAGLAVFMFTGFVKQIPIEIEEAAMIDGCTPVQTYFQVVFPIMKPTTITVAILESMWIWNDYLLPSLVLSNKYKTIQIAVQTLKSSHGNIEWGSMMAVLVMAIVPIIVFYACAQKYIIEGVVAGAVKG